MTVIAYDGLCIAADSLHCHGHERVLRPLKKLHFARGLIYAISGCSVLTAALIEWHQQGADRKSAPQATDPKEHPWGLWVIDPNRPETLTSYQSECLYSYEAYPPFTMGSGSDIALGALLAQKTAVEAVEIACMVNITCGLPVQKINIEEARRIGTLLEAAE